MRGAGDGGRTADGRGERRSVGGPDISVRSLADGGERQRWRGGGRRLRLRRRRGGRRGGWGKARGWVAAARVLGRPLVLRRGQGEPCAKSLEAATLAPRNGRGERVGRNERRGGAGRGKRERRRQQSRGYRGGYHVLQCGGACRPLSPLHLCLPMDARPPRAPQTPAGGPRARHITGMIAKKKWNRARGLSSRGAPDPARHARRGVHGLQPLFTPQTNHPAPPLTSDGAWTACPPPLLPPPPRVRPPVPPGVRGWPRPPRRGGRPSRPGAPCAAPRSGTGP